MSWESQTGCRETLGRWTGDGLVSRQRVWFFLLPMTSLVPISYMQGIALKSGTNPHPPNQLPLQEKQGGISNTYNQICMAAREGGGCWEERFKKGRALAVVSPKFSLANSQGNLFSSCVESLLCTRHFQ